MSDYCIVISTFPDHSTAHMAGHVLVQAGLAACAQVHGPLRSIYRWQGQVEEAQEYELRLKTRRELGAKIEAHLRQLHPYELPQILYVSMEGSRAYLEWVDSCLTF